MVANQWLQLDLLLGHLLMRHVALEPNLPEHKPSMPLQWLVGWPQFDADWSDGFLLSNNFALQAGMLLQQQQQQQQ